VSLTNLRVYDCIDVALLVKTLLVPTTSNY
jgi:hypothetical protein